MADVDSELNKAYEDLRGINTNIAALSGRPVVDRENRKRISMNDEDGKSPPPESGSTKRVLVQTPDGENTAKRRIIVYDEPDNRAKRGRFEEREQRRFVPAAGPRAPLPRHALQSTVVLPIETKSRDETINKIKQNEKKEDAVRNKRLMGRLLVGTLSTFRKEQKTIAPKADKQKEIQMEIDKRLEQTKKADKEEFRKQKFDLLAKRREKEIEIQRLRRRKAIELNAKEKEKHFTRLQQFIQTQAKPPLFYLPAKHTERTLELLKESAKNIDGLIEKCRDECEKELKRDDELAAKLHANLETVPAGVNVTTSVEEAFEEGDLELGDEDEDEDLDRHVVRSVVTVVEPKAERSPEEEGVNLEE